MVVAVVAPIRSYTISEGFRWVDNPAQQASELKLELNGVPVPFAERVRSSFPR